MLKKYLSFISTSLLCYILIFWFIQKPIFILYNLNHIEDGFSLTDIKDIYYHGMALDFATTGYFLAIPFVMLLIQIFIKRIFIHKVLKIYNIFIAFLLALITLADASMYEFWEFKLDSTIFMYLDDPKNAFASVTFGYILIRLVVLFLLSALLYYILNIPVRSLKINKSWHSFKELSVSTLCMLLVGGVIFAMIRGLRIWPNTPGRAYYSKTAFYNHSALNPIFNLAYSTLQMDEFDDVFNFYPNDVCEKKFKELYPPTNGTAEYLLNNKRPNILFVVLEGFGSVFIENLGGMKDVGVNFSRISEKGILFRNCICNSFRTDRGIVSVLSGYLAQPTTSIMRFSNKIKSLPGIAKSLKEYGYETQGVYGGDITFFNMSDYLISAGHDKLISQDDFPISDRTAKWGVHDEKTFEWVYNDIQQKYKEGKNQWYTTFLTLSSHTPFDVPFKKLEDEKLNSFAYTDSCFGAFIDKIEKTPAWDDLLIVCIADHGYNHREIASPDFPYIPMLWLGGAIKQPMKIDKIVNQTDLVATLLGQLDIPYDEYKFSRNVFSPSYKYPFAINTFNNGFIFRDSTGCTVFDNTLNKATYGEDSLREEKGKVILQTLYEDLRNR